MNKLRLVPLVLSLLSVQVQAHKSDMPIVQGTSNTIDISNISDVFDAIKRVRAAFAIPELEVKAPVAETEWVTSEATFDYVKPCVAINYVAIVSNIANHKDLLVENDEGKLVHARDRTVGYQRLADNCVTIVAPKTGLSTTYNEYGDAEHWRNWWMTAGVEDDNGIPVRDANAEIEATIALVKLAISATGAPVYLVMGNDSGESSANVLDRLLADGEDKLVSGFIHIDYETGEFTTYSRDGTVWKSEDHPVTE